MISAGQQSPKEWQLCILINDHPAEINTKRPKDCMSPKMSSIINDWATWAAISEVLLLFRLKKWLCCSGCKGHSSTPTKALLETPTTTLQSSPVLNPITRITEMPQLKVWQVHQIKAKRKSGCFSALMPPFQSLLPSPSTCPTNHLSQFSDFLHPTLSLLCWFHPWH